MCNSATNGHLRCFVIEMKDMQDVLNHLLMMQMETTLLQKQQLISAAPKYSQFTHLLATMALSLQLLCRTLSWSVQGLLTIDL